MNTATLNRTEKTKKLIELPNDICRKLAIQAAAMGTSVKRLMENMIINSIEEVDDEAVYTYLSETRPDGNIMLSDEEQADLINRIRTKASKDEI